MIAYLRDETVLRMEGRNAANRPMSSQAEVSRESEGQNQIASGYARKVLSAHWSELDYRGRKDDEQEATSRMSRVGPPLNIS